MSELKIVIEEHKKCPCCHSEDISVGSVVVLDREELYIKCNSCGLKLQIRKEYGYGELLKHWNTRKSMERIMQRLEDETIALEDNYGDFVECIPKEIAIEIVKEEGGMNEIM